MIEVLLLSMVICSLQFIGQRLNYLFAINIILTYQKPTVAYRLLISLFLF